MARDESKKLPPLDELSRRIDEAEPRAFVAAPQRAMTEPASPLDRIAGPVDLKTLAIYAGFWRASQAVEALSRGDSEAYRACLKASQCSEEVWRRVDPKRDSPIAWLDVRQPIHERMEYACSRLLDVLRCEPMEVLRRFGTV